MTTTLYAGPADTLRYNQERVYLGARVGMATAEGDFSSFGKDKFRPGWNLGLSAGYRFTDVWSLELAASWGQAFLAEQKCCAERHYFLGSDMNRYHPALIPEGMQGYYYEDIVSKTFVQRYGLLANMNVLGFFNSRKGGPWTLELSPALYAVGTCANILTKADKTPIAENISKWHLGYGARIQASYAIAENMNIGIYGEFTQLTGQQLDGMPKLHVSNNIIDFGVKFTFGFKKSGKIRRPVVPSVPVNQVAAPVPVSQTEEVKVTEAPVEQPATAEEPVQQQAVTADVPAEQKSVEAKPAQVENAVAKNSEPSVPVSQPAAAETPVEVSPEEQPCDCEVKESTFPVIYFSFNSIWIEPSQRAKVKEIADRMKADKSIRIRVTGWCDPVGSVEANKRVSLQRAEAVKRVLGQWLIPADRVETAGGGICKGTASYDQARCALTIEIL